jgi:hypothetical protein
MQTEPNCIHGTVLTRTLHVNITGTLTNLAMSGPSGATWKLVDGKQIGVFGLGSEVDAQVATNQLRTALIHELKLLQGFALDFIFCGPSSCSKTKAGELPRTGRRKRIGNGTGPVLTQARSGERRQRTPGITKYN